MPISRGSRHEIGTVLAASCECRANLRHAGLLDGSQSVIPKLSIPSTLTLLADAQCGALSRAQLRQMHLSVHLPRRCLAEGHWVSLRPGIYSTWRPPQPMTWAWAAVLAGGPHAGLGARTALALAGLEELSLPVTAFTDRKVSSCSHIVFVRGTRALSGEPPRTSVADALLDAWPEADEDMMAAWLGRAVQRRLTSPRQVAAAAERRSRLARRRALMDLLGDTGTGAESALEVRYLRQVERAHRLPVGLRQVQGDRARCDVAYGITNEVTGLFTPWLLVELDGQAFHSGSRFRDLERDNRHAAWGLPTLRYGWRDVTRRPCQVAQQVAAALRAAGWEGQMRRCVRCR